MKNRIVITAVVLFALAAPSSFAGAKATHGSRRAHKLAAVRIVSMSQSGGNVTLRLEDGRSIEAPENRVHVMQTTPMRESAAPKDRKAARSNASAIASLSSMSSPLPAVATVLYAKDGSIRRVRVRMLDANAPALSKAKAGSK